MLHGLTFFLEVFQRTETYSVYKYQNGPLDPLKNLSTLWDISRSYFPFVLKHFAFLLFYVLFHYYSSFRSSNAQNKHEHNKVENHAIILKDWHSSEIKCHLRNLPVFVLCCPGDGIVFWEGIKESWRHSICNLLEARMEHSWKFKSVSLSSHVTMRRKLSVETVSQLSGRSGNECNTDSSRDSKGDGEIDHRSKILGC